MSIIIAENRLDPNDISITGEITIQPDASNEQIPQDLNSSNRPEHDDGPADPNLSLESNASTNPSTSLNSNMAEDPMQQNISQVDDIKQWEIERKKDQFFSDDKEVMWDDDGDEVWDATAVTESTDKNNKPPTTNRIESLPQKQNVTTASPDVRERTNNDSQNGYQGNTEMTMKNVLTSNQVDEHTERISTNLMIDDTTGKLRNNTTNTSLTPLPFERLRHPKRIERNSSSTNVTLNEDLNNRKSKIENTNSILMNK